MYSVDFVELDWKNVVTLKTEHDNLILCNFQTVLVLWMNISYNLGLHI